MANKKVLQLYKSQSRELRLAEDYGLAWLLLISVRRQARRLDGCLRVRHLKTIYVLTLCKRGDRNIDPAWIEGKCVDDKRAKSKYAVNE